METIKYLDLFSGIGAFKRGLSNAGKRIFSIDGVSPTITTKNTHHFQEIKGKLTPQECLLLTGFNENDYIKLENTIPKGQIYKQAGNSIVVPVAEAILSKLFI